VVPRSAHTLVRHADTTVFTAREIFEFWLPLTSLTLTLPYQIRIDRMDSHGGWAATPADVLRFMVQGRRDRLVARQSRVGDDFAGRRPQAATFAKRSITDGSSSRVIPAMYSASVSRPLRIISSRL
jgi:hypothetical protein